MITAAVITRNEEHNIADCLASLVWADELLVLDSFSTDRTVAIALGYTDRVFQREFKSFPTQRNAALELARGDWILFVDADERVPSELAAEIRDLLSEGRQQRSTDRAGYWIPRRNIILGKWMRHTGWYPDYQLRLLRRGGAYYDESQEVHEVARLEGPAGYLKNPLIHYNYQRLGQFLAKQEFYATFAARTMLGQNLRPRPHNFVLQPLREFWRRYITLEGYRDGGHGLLLSLLLAYYNFVAYRRLAKMWRAQDRPRPENEILSRQDL